MTMLMLMMLTLLPMLTTIIGSFLCCFLCRSSIARAGVVAFVDTLAVLRGKAVWRQSDEEQDFPPQPGGFKLGGEEHLLFRVCVVFMRAPLQACDIETAHLFDWRHLHLPELLLL